MWRFFQLNQAFNDDGVDVRISVFGIVAGDGFGIREPIICSRDGLQEELVEKHRNLLRILEAVLAYQLAELKPFKHDFIVRTASFFYMDNYIRFLNYCCK
ncbi:hypothetical protein Y032_0049g1733 [Ancylostoma ceylanicum]|nr:hypothetical protein Y032_0049g1733 [Ancylostoma ceylanicum]